MFFAFFDNQEQQMYYLCPSKSIDQKIKLLHS